MGKEKQKHVLAVVLLSFLLTIVTALSANAEVRPSVMLGKNDTIVSSLVGEINTNAKFELLEYQAGTGIVLFDSANYKVLDLDERRRIMADSLDAVQQSSLSAQKMNKFYNFLADRDTPVSSAIRNLKGDVGADFSRAMSWFGKISNPIGVILGLLTIGIFMLLSFSIVLDVFFIAIPFVQTRGLTRAGESKRVWGISASAMKAVRRAEEEDGSAISFWIRNRFLEVIVVCVVLMLLVTGTFWDVIAWLVALFGG